MGANEEPRVLRSFLLVKSEVNDEFEVKQSPRFEFVEVARVDHVLCVKGLGRPRLNSEE